MSVYTFSRRSTPPVPPLKGSFPLDHEGLCKSFMIKYSRCLAENGNKLENCRIKSQEYLECRMNNGLMTREEWPKLGFSNTVEKET